MVTTSYLVVRLLPYMVLLNAAQLVLERSDASDALEAAIGFLCSTGLLVFAGYQANVLGGTRGQAMWSAWWITMIGVVVTMLESGWRLRSVPATPLSMPLTISSSDQINTMLMVIVVIMAVLALVTLVVCWLLAGFGYWIAEGAASRP
jgi:hypothetical protein